MIRIGVLSDTHLSGTSDFFYELAASCFEDVSVILHAGDLTDLSVLEVFGDKEVHAVHGNMCHPAARAILPTKKVIEIGGFVIGLIHRVGNSYDFEKNLRDEFDEVDCIVYGHTHKAVCHRFGGVLYVNPGSFLPISPYGASGTYVVLEAGNTLSGTIHKVKWPE